ncbi:MHYT domain-containing protein [Frankia sp. CiP3]|uniref:MHYT domain-containing protein n=1 Tax=Frankia sp. CiP3 TaxID=2880971 RepID=UPI001EF5A7FA|nr:MHYT domain-containing protein [Frankia sp. CiP3]
MDLTTATRHAADYDLLFVGVSVALATVGSFAALVSALRIPLSGAATRLRWVLSAALSLGGGAIWAMHFMGMVAYHIDGMDITYDIGLTALSLVIAVAVSGIGLVLVGTNPHSVRVWGPAGSLPVSASRQCTTQAWPRCGPAAPSRMTRSLSRSRSS